MGQSTEVTLGGYRPTFSWARPSLARPHDGAGLRVVLGRLAVVVWTVGVLLAASGDGRAQGGALSLGETEDLVRARHYEGLPEEEAQQIGPEGCARLVEMLADPEEARHHAQILLAIGHCGPEGGLEAIAAWADRPREGEIDRATFRAWQALPFALARLADHDARAVARLTARLADERPPRWTFRHHRGDRLVKLNRRAAALGLAETDDPAAEAALERAARDARDGSLRAHFERARERHRERRGMRRDRRGGTQR